MLVYTYFFLIAQSLFINSVAELCENRYWRLKADTHSKMGTFHIVLIALSLLTLLADIAQAGIDVTNITNCATHIAFSSDLSVTISSQTTIDADGLEDQDCVLHITSSRSLPTRASIRGGTLSGLDYLYVEKLKNLCSSKYVSYNGSSETRCDITLPYSWKLNFRGEISITIRETESGIIGDDMCRHRTSCKGWKEFNTITKCKQPESQHMANHLVCELTKSDNSNCTYILRDQEVVSTCYVNNQYVNSKTFLLFPHNMTKYAFLDISNQNIGTLDVNVFRTVAPLISAHQLPSYFNLSDNLISNIEVGTFNGLSSLLVLFLEYNHIEVLTNNNFKGAENLVRLKLNSNWLRIIESGAFANLKIVQYISLENNRLESLQKGTFAGLYNLTHLDLNINRLSNLPSDLFEDLRNLKRLNLQHNYLERLPTLSYMSQLMILLLQNNGLHEIVRKDFRNLPDTLDIVMVTQHEICECYMEHTDACVATDKSKVPYLPCGRLLAEVVLVCFTWIIGFAALLGNIFVLCWRKVAKEQENKVQSLLLRNLATSDLMMGLYMLIIASADVHFGEYFPMWSQTWRFSNMCKIAGTLAITSSEASVFFVTLISIDRYLCIRYPSPTSNQINTKMGVIVVVTWFVAFILGLVPSLLSGRASADFYENSHVCIGLPLARLQKYQRVNQSVPQQTLDNTLPHLSIDTGIPLKKESAMYYSTTVFLGLNLLCFLIVFLCYLEITRIVHKSLKRNQRDMKRQVQLTLRVSAIVATDFCTWCPIIVIGILVQANAIDISPRVFAWMVTIVLPINSAINPYLYTLATVIATHLKQKLSKEPIENMEVQALTNSKKCDDGMKTNISLISQRNGMQEDDQL